MSSVLIFFMLLLSYKRKMGINLKQTEKQQAISIALSIGKVICAHSVHGLFVCPVKICQEAQGMVIWILFHYSNLFLESL